MRTTPAVLSALLLAALPAVATAQGTALPGATGPSGTSGPTGPSGATGPAPAPSPAKAKLTIHAEKVGRGHAVLAGSSWRVRGTLRPYVAGQKAVVRFTRGNKRLKARTVTLRPSSSGKSGTFVVAFRTRGPGRVHVRASHAGTAALATTVARPAAVDVLPLRAGPGSKSSTVRILQQRLARLGYVVGRRGSYDGRTARAVLAFRKVLGLARTQRADRTVFRRLAAGQGAFKPKYPKHGRHVEGDISRQVMVLVGANGKPEQIYSVSSGKASTPTILGSFKVYRKEPGTNSHGMVNSSYFSGGYAIHGYADVPTYNASHGCLRVPVPDALRIFRWVRYGTPVDTYP